MNEKEKQLAKLMNKLRGKLIISCQALPNEPLYSSFIMSKMALAATLAGAAGIRANTVPDIREIRGETTLPIIGILKRAYAKNPVFITPTTKEVDELMAVMPEVIATDATSRPRPDGKSLPDFLDEIQKKYPDQLFMADVSTYEEGIFAEKIGFDIVGTTLHGYTAYTKDSPLPNFDLIERLSADLKIPLIAEGGIHYPEELRRVFQAGADSAVVGGAITRPLEIARRFISVLENPKNLE